MKDEMIRAENLSYSFQGTNVLDNISFSLEENHFAAFIGPSGCGKTTLLHILAGIYKNYEGTLSVHSSHISFVFQKDSLLEWRNAIQNVLLPFELDGESEGTADLEQKASEMLSLVGLEGYEYFFPHQLSGGMRKRVEIARALVTDPDLLILDEPFSALDLITREKLNTLVKQLHSLRKTTVVLVTHSVEEACFLSDRIFVMSHKPSRIIQVREIENKNETRYDRFLLTQEELEANNAIRESAKALWAEDALCCPIAASPAGRAGRQQRDRREPGRRRTVLPADRENTRGVKLAPVGEAPSTGKGRENRRGGFVFKKRHNIILIPLELTALYFILTFLKDALEIPDLIFPYPRQILTRFIDTLLDGSIFSDLMMTVTESLSGFLIAFFITMILGYLIAKSRLLSSLLMPYLVAANTIPSVALAPFLVLWFGFGLTPKIVTSVIVIFFPMLINNTSAIKLGEQSVRDLLRFYRPSWIKSFSKFEFPAALPVIFSGVKISITLSVIGAVVGEFVSGHTGLGALVSRAKANFDVDLMFVGLIWLILLGLGYYGIANFIYFLILRKRQGTGSIKGKKLSKEYI